MKLIYFFLVQFVVAHMTRKKRYLYAKSIMICLKICSSVYRDLFYQVLKFRAFAAIVLWAVLPSVQDVFLI